MRFVTKMPTSSIKAVYRLCPLSLTVARAETPDGIVLATTLTIADDPAAALMLSGVVRHAEEQLALENILRSGQTLMIFFDEASRPVARAQCTMSAVECAAASKMVDAIGTRYVGSWTPTLSDVLDEVQGHADPQLTVPAKYTPAYVAIPVTLSDFETSRMTTVGLEGEALDFSAQRSK